MTSEDRVIGDTAPGGEVPVVSVVVTTHNRSKQLQEALDSVLALEGRGDFTLDLVVVDDGSTDDTPEVLGARSGVRSVRTSGIGMARARTLGLETARGDFVTLLDDDDVLLPEAISAQLAMFAAHPEYASVHGQSILTHADLSPFGEPVPSGPLKSGMILDQLLGYFPQVATILTRMSAAREAGAFDPSLPGDNDWDWLLRIARRHPIGVVETPVMLFRQRDSAQEHLAWRRFPAVTTIFRRHTADLPLARRVRLQLVLWRVRGWWASLFLIYADQHWAGGERRRAARSAWYALRASPPHLVVGLARRALGRLSRRGAR